ncbi:6178_t:CDS:2 [Dentiscutata erythropus]|uniref:6178_t:CDS:1 n=1 Tax=Dentiscutata erythropus TaxID=1348616 RepID=A0A9N9F6E5_9GLOM|nr:6178_t:CDS:2 [Dentiscutata erythropus]
MDALRNRSFKEDMTTVPLPLPKEVFGIEEPMKIDGLEIFDQKNKEYNPMPENQKYLCARDFTEAYLAKRITPVQVCEKLIENINQSCSEACDPPLYGMCQYHQNDIMAQAEASTTRYSQNRSLGPLDGVPVAIKDEIDVLGYETHVGTSFFNRGNPASRDAFLIKKLKEQGAIIIGKTNMGFGVTTKNPNTHITRNPYNSDHYCGGSSGGSACVVSSGICPIAIGCDAGGSIRIPSSFCGIYGLKPTYGRVSSTGDYLSCTYNGMMYTQLANFIGIPAITVPAGYNDKDLPIGLQFMAKWYDEAILLRVAKASEEILGSRRRKPSEKYWFGDLL